MGKIRWSWHCNNYKMRQHAKVSTLNLHRYISMTWPKLTSLELRLGKACCELCKRSQNKVGPMCSNRMVIKVVCPKNIFYELIWNMQPIMRLSGLQNIKKSWIEFLKKLLTFWAKKRQVSLKRDSQMDHFGRCNDRDFGAKTWTPSTLIVNGGFQKML